MPGALPVLPGVYLARVEGTWEGLPSENLFCFKVTPAPGSGTADASAASLVSSSVAAHWPAFALDPFPTQYTANQVATYPLGSPLVPAQIATMSAVGGNTSLPAAAPIAMLIAHATTRRGRGSQSRTFLSPVPVGSVTSDGRSIVSTTQTLVTTAFSTFIGSVLSDLDTDPGGSWAYVQLSKVGAGATFPITASHVETLVSTQRRRARRRST